MKWLKLSVLLIGMLSTIPQSYPQYMLSKKCEYQYVRDVNIVDKVYNSKNEYLDIDVHIPQLINNDPNSNLGWVNDKIVQWTELWINDVKQIADEYYKGKVPPLAPYQLYAKYEITQQSDIISLFIDYYQFTGGAHGITTRISYNIDSETGKALKLDELFKTGYDYKTVINNEINKQINKEPDKYFKDKDGFNGIDDKDRFFIKPGEIVIYYEPYEIAPYASGLPQFSISTKVFKGNYLYDKINNI